MSERVREDAGRRGYPTRASSGRRLHATGFLIAAMLFVLLTTVIVASDVLLPWWTGSGDLRVGQVAEQNVLSPFSITFESEVLTELNRSEAAAAVAQVYDPPDPNVSRTQVCWHARYWITSAMHEVTASARWRSARMICSRLRR